MELTIAISALQHFAYCPRQCGLIHLESVWDENLFTLKGSREHARVDSGQTTWENGVRTERALPLFSDRLGLTGKADAVEFHPDGRVVPVEHKRSGGKRPSRPNDIQLCAQALCLEEMLGRPVAEGAIFSLQTRRRRTVALDDALRADTFAAIDAVRALLSGDTLPPAVDDARCPNCSLIDACVPATVVAARAAWHARALFRLEAAP